jgi:hypothetical protein
MGGCSRRQACSGPATRQSKCSQLPSTSSMRLPVLLADCVRPRGNAAVIAGISQSRRRARPRTRSRRRAGPGPPAPPPADLHPRQTWRRRRTTVSDGIAIPDRDDIAALTAGYGLIIADECHHVPAAAFQDAVRQIPARRWLGLTATPYRRDKLDDLITMHVGPVRHAISSPRELAALRDLLEGTGSGGRQPVTSYTKWDRDAYIERVGGPEEAERRRKALMARQSGQRLAEERKQRGGHRSCMPRSARPCPFICYVQQYTRVRERAST